MKSQLGGDNEPKDAISLQNLKAFFQHHHLLEKRKKQATVITRDENAVFGGRDSATHTHNLVCHFAVPNIYTAYP